MIRAQIRLRTANITNADTEDSVAVLLNSATSLYAVPSGNKTWLDYPHDDFERGADFLYDLSLGHVSEIGDINMISIQKSGGDAWCLAGFDLIINNKAPVGADSGTVLFTRSFENLPGGCLWLTDASPSSNMFTVSFPELRATPGWYTLNPLLLPLFNIEETTSQLSAVLGDMMHGTALFWGPNGSVKLSSRVDQNALHVDATMKAEADKAFNPEVYVSLDLAVNGGCEADGSLTLVIEPTNVKVNAELGVLKGIASGFECVGTLKGGPLCVQNAVETKVRDAFRAASIDFTSDGIDTCLNNPNQRWLVGGNGIISLSR